MTGGPTAHDVLSLPELEELARRRLPATTYEYLASGAADEHTVRWNREAYDRLRLRPRVLRDVAAVDTRLTLLGTALPFPILLAPTAYHRAMHPEGELATAAGAGAAGAAWVVSGATTTPLEAIAAVARAPLWFQLYVQPTRDANRDIVATAEGAGCTALCVTVDTPVLGARDRQTRARFGLPEGVTAPYMAQRGGRPITDIHRAVSVTWDDVAWLRSVARVPLLLKGILTADDAALAVDAGADGVIVSNHGGRNLDTLPATIDALPEVVAAVGDRVPVLVDGGVRRGTDVLKALASGARAVLVGRPYCYALALFGADGVTRVVEILRAELEMAMQLTGRRTLDEVDRGALWDG
ncbi:FMN-dependent alpha-hydroxy acid dehydrogenase [Gemmatirosa kalamazoonensis]|uniref:FMN-dependent alpha-hydroxy acid dehydrogenase n=1 Tax=Gemmatirosa kalamazoonensis TaxID=861299 RepID=W0RFM1_9BACT|nr:alpha-hydroxy acid oxidase [Gemmatirosa kalamazoonensis]AHG88178.1 FMN-dependent alpha-hydroxy acid dehydrogenase [Gemmatirosa kalamazoonensis]